MNKPLDEDEKKYILSVIKKWLEAQTQSTFVHGE
jgi:hypothetical protein